MAGDYLDNHARLTFGGSAYNRQEIWQTGFHLTMGNPPSDVAKKTVSDALAAFCASNFCDSHILEWIKWAPLDRKGHYASDGAVVTWEKVIEPSTSGHWPPQTCVVATLGGESRKGTASHGRLYLPPPSEGLQPDGRLRQEYATTLAKSVAALIKAINTADGGSLGTVILASRQGKRQPAGMQHVTRVRVGRVLDTQRRRRNALAEEYQEVPLG